MCRLGRRRAEWKQGDKQEATEIIQVRNNGDLDGRMGL